MAFGTSCGEAAVVEAARSRRVVAIASAASSVASSSIRISRARSPFAGLSYVNLDLFGRGAQVNVFFGGVFGQASWTAPVHRGDTLASARQRIRHRGAYTDRVFRNGREQYAEELLQRPAYVSAGVLRPLTPRVRATLRLFAGRHWPREDGQYAGAVSKCRSRSLTMVRGSRLMPIAARGAFADGGTRSRRHRWRAWGLPGALRSSDAKLPAIRRAADADACPADVGELAHRDVVDGGSRPGSLQPVRLRQL